MQASGSPLPRVVLILSALLLVPSATAQDVFFEEDPNQGGTPTGEEDALLVDAVIYGVVIALAVGTIVHMRKTNARLLGRPPTWAETLTPFPTYLKARKAPPPAATPPATSAPVNAHVGVGHGSAAVVGSNNQVVIHAPAGTSGVHPRHQPLFDALVRAETVLDVRGATQPVIEARDEVRDAIGDMRRGEPPQAGRRARMAAMLEAASAETSIPKIRDGAADLRAAIRELNA
ncbi:MAG TPA: hypothetical protein VHH36_08500 [Candidatus Thermoplasmatota archaeon]|nr:hypothetical protein [Candidatus Thermoplasmatota archaeon]